MNYLSLAGNPDNRRWVTLNMLSILIIFLLFALRVLIFFSAKSFTVFSCSYNFGHVLSEENILYSKVDIL